MKYVCILNIKEEFLISSIIWDWYLSKTVFICTFRNVYGLTRLLYNFSLFQVHQHTYHQMCYCANLTSGNRQICGLWASFFIQCCTVCFPSATPVSLSYSAESKLPIIIYLRKYTYFYLCQIWIYLNNLLQRSSSNKSAWLFCNVY